MASIDQDPMPCAGVSSKNTVIVRIPEKTEQPTMPVW